ncbi:hypothetical protein D3C77_555850 [compost metagenome]
MNDIKVFGQWPLTFKRADDCRFANDFWFVLKYPTLVAFEHLTNLLLLYNLVQTRHR